VYNSIDLNKITKRAKKCHNRLKQFENKKRELNKQYVRDLSKLVENDLKELESIAKTLVHDDDIDNVSTVTVEVSNHDDFFEQ
tara:strand:- start:805 stop:1053 length:249 start_codon:yes stop_codon:yes gene_type:complete